MNYINKFESFASENKFDYTLGDINNILKERNIHVTNLDYLDSGAYGNAFKLNENLVLKITTSDSEVYYASKLLNVNSNYLVNIKDVFFHEYFDMGYIVRNGFIIMEYLNADRRKFNRFIDYLHVHNPISDRYENVPMVEVINYFKDRLVGVDDEVIIEMFNYYKDIRKELEKYNLPHDDLRGSNIGYRNNRPIFFDISSIYSSEKYDYSNIEIINTGIKL